jgi:hypothetical protein
MFLVNKILDMNDRTVTVQKDKNISYCFAKSVFIMKNLETKCNHIIGM